MKLRRIKAAYYKPKSGEWLEPASPRKRGYRLACCDCGLTHILKFRVHNGRIQFAAFHARRATAAVRRHNKVADYGRVLVAIKKAIEREKVADLRARRRAKRTPRRSRK